MATEGDGNKLYNANEFAWSDLSTWGAWNNWRGFNTSGVTVSTTLAYVLPTVDLGSVKTVVPLASATSDGTHVFTFETSTDNVTFSSATSPLTGRYMRTTVTVTNTLAVPALQSADVEFVDDVFQTETFHNLDTSTLVQNTDESFTVPIQKSYEAITDITGTAGNTESRPLLVIIDDDNASAPRFRVINLDTFGKVAIADGVINLTVRGYEATTTNASGNIG
jgi:hypothetical protein